MQVEPQLILEILGFVGGLLAVYVKLSTKLATIEVKVETIWSSLVRRAFSEAVNKGMGTLNSPLLLKQEALDLMAPMAKELRDFYASEGRKYVGDDEALMLAIESKFGDKIVKEVCVPNALASHACLLIAIAVAKSTNVVDNRTLQRKRRRAV